MPRPIYYAHRAKISCPLSTQNPSFLTTQSIILNAKVIKFIENSSSFIPVGHAIADKLPLLHAIHKSLDCILDTCAGLLEELALHNSSFFNKEFIIVQ